MDFSNSISRIKQLFSGADYSLKKYRWFLFVFAFILYAGTTSNEYALDDTLVVENHKFVTKGVSGIPEILQNPYQETEEQVGEYRPVPQITFAVEYEMFGAKPAVSHFFNAVLYALVCVLLFSVFLKLAGTAYFGYVLLGTLLFIAHPIHTEVVASLKNRENILSMLFGLLSCIYFMKYLESSSKKFLVFCGIAFLLGLLSKIDAVVFAGIITLIAFYKNAGFKKVIFCTMGLVAVYFAMNILREMAFPVSFRTNHLYETPLFGDVSFTGKLTFALVTLWHYLKLLLLPFPLRFYYGYNMIPLPEVADPLVWISLVIHILLLVVAIRGLKKRTLLSFSIWWYLLSISIFSQLAEPVTGIIGERHAFIASAGFCMALAVALISVAKYARRHIRESSLYIAAALCFAALFIGSFVYIQGRNKDWKTGESLFEADMHKLQHSAYAHFEYGNTLTRKSDRSTEKAGFQQAVYQAIGEYKQAAAVYPDFSFAWYNVGISYVRLDSMEKAEPYFKKAWETDSTFRSTNYFLGLQAMERNDTLAAIGLYERELRYRTENVRAIERLYDLYISRKMTGKALGTFLEVAEKKPRNSRVYVALGHLYKLKGDEEKAQYYYTYSQSREVDDNVPFYW